MDQCCDDKPSTDKERSRPCPANGHPYSRVKRKTLLHHVKHPWKNNITGQAYYFCTDVDCDVVYFGQDDTTFKTDDLRTTVWQKSDSEQANICYCFGVTKKIASSDTNFKTFVIEQTRNSLCSCETSNPSGRCCLKDFPKQ